eukprot:GEMP01089090.1.p1 GENE.GEMP01089090.1~~GEMP01089090.1.p1  ORF type:complete len:178 (+),score=10.65 GEMP01089090.1:99-632(+)
MTMNLLDLLNIDAPALINKSITEDYISENALNIPPLRDPPDNLAAAFEAVIDDPISRGESVVPLLDEVILPDDDDWNLSRYMLLPSDVLSNMPSTLTTPGSLLPLTCTFASPYIYIKFMCVYIHKKRKEGRSRVRTEKWLFRHVSILHIFFGAPVLYFFLCKIVRAFCFVFSLYIYV